MLSSSSLPSLPHLSHPGHNIHTRLKHPMGKGVLVSQSDLPLSLSSRTRVHLYIFFMLSSSLLSSELPLYQSCIFFTLFCPSLRPSSSSSSSRDVALHPNHVITFIYVFPLHSVASSLHQTHFWRFSLRTFPAFQLIIVESAIQINLHILHIPQARLLTM